MEVVPVTTSQGVELLRFVQEIRKLCSQLADLLGTSDKFMSDAGWEIATAQNIAYASPSQSLDKPRKWFPHEVFRFYQHVDNARVITFVSALLDDDRKGEYMLDEPLLSAGWLEFVDKAIDRVPSELWWWARFHGYMPKRRDDGSLNEISPKTAWPDDYRPNWYPFERAVTFAHPLIAIGDSAALQERIIAPLLTALSRSSIAAHL